MQFGVVEQPIHQLFGGAMQSHIDASLCDISTVRPLPDTQEQFINRNNGYTLTFDIMYMLDKDIKSSLDTYAHDLTLHPQIKMTLNNIQYSEFKLEYENIALTCQHQTVYQNKVKNNVLSLVLLRLKQYRTDLLIYSLNPNVNDNDVIFKDAVESFLINDYTIFAPEVIETQNQVEQ
ncbi:Ran-interacting_Mog1 protein domain-containing protein [Hexamita inflata]|uniref:Ran-interacting Mog1 protein domain-containing protein n=1 Tax=Hexamita inflata TaxID=28002 RepID=A0AA86P9D3_9EUKA|nr:Ran-interacting Mog1 protein domain-containing protein [Hexamita inflata]CAI9941762.1 Ran-interacting Mog1 protein domain-containing protein [Hexamita inflata]